MYLISGVDTICQVSAGDRGFCLFGLICEGVEGSKRPRFIEGRERGKKRRKGVECRLLFLDNAMNYLGKKPEEEQTLL